MRSISLKEATEVVDNVLAKARELNFEPLTAVVLDAGGHVVSAKREDGSGIIRFELAFGKAYGALGFGLGSRDLAGKAKNAPGFMVGASDASGGRCVPAPGGVLIKTSEGSIIGAVGISGDTGNNDEICAVAAIEAVGLTPDAG